MNKAERKRLKQLRRQQRDLLSRIQKEADRWFNEPEIRKRKIEKKIETKKQGGSKY